MAAFKNLPCFLEENGIVTVLWERVTVHVPENFFTEPQIADDLNGKLDTIFFIDIHAIQTETSKERVFAIRLPARMQFNYNEVDTFTDETGEKFRTYTIYKNEVFLESVNIIKDSSYVNQLFKIMSGGRIKGVAYEDLGNLLIEGSKLNGVNLSIDRVILEAMVSEMSRWTKDNSIPFRIPYSTGKAGADDFDFIKLLAIPRLNSVLTGVGFQDINQSVQSSVVMSRNNVPQRISPVEKVIKY